jgi:hypothetical protein
MHSPVKIVTKKSEFGHAFEDDPDCRQILIAAGLRKLVGAIVESTRGAQSTATHFDSGLVPKTERRY